MPPHSAQYRSPENIPISPIVDCDKVNAELRENNIGIHSHLEIITSEAAHVFYNDTLDPSCLDVCKHTLEAQTVEVCAGITVVLVITAERRLSDLALLIKHTVAYKELKPLYSEYKKSRNKEKYLRGHEREIILFEASARALKAAGVGDKLPDLAKLREEYSRLSEEKDRLYAEYGSLKKHMREYDAVKQNIDSILPPNRGQEQDKAL